MTISKRLMGVALASLSTLVMSGCAVSDLADEMSEDKFTYDKGVVFQADRTTVYASTTNGVDLEDEGIVLYTEGRARVGWITTGRTVIDTNRDFVGNCIPLQSEDDGWESDSFTEDGFLQGSCYLDR